MMETVTRASLTAQSHQVFSAIEINRFRILDGTYACQLSADQKLLFTANRGLNQIVLYDYPSNERRLRVRLPALHRYFPRMRRWQDPRLGLHHGHLVGPPRAPAPAAA
jgi:6-phosphogluconolactonase (cycloisomerase 2 family)